MTTDTRTDACPHCGAGVSFDPLFASLFFRCGAEKNYQSDLCHERQASQKAKAEVERLTGRMKEAADLIKKLHTENVCLQELIQELYEWTRRDYPTEQEVREIMNRYHDLLNK